MQYNREKFNDYFKNYLDIKSRIDDTKELIKDLKDDDLVRHSLNEKIVFELQKGLNRLYADFLTSDAYPFSKDNFHFLVSNGTYLIDAINDEDSSKLSEDENMFLSDCTTSTLNYDPNSYSESDIPAIKVFYLRNKDKNNIYANIVSNILLARMLDFDCYNVRCSLDNSQKQNIKKWKKKLRKEKREIINCKSNQKQLLLFSLKAASYELELLEGGKVTDIYNHLINILSTANYKKNNKEISKRLYYMIFNETINNIDALIKAYYNLTDIEFRKNSGYYSGESYIYSRYETEDPQINKRLLKMMKR